MSYKAVKKNPDAQSRIYLNRINGMEYFASLGIVYCKSVGKAKWLASAHDLRDLVQDPMGKFSLVKT